MGVQAREAAELRHPVLNVEESGASVQSVEPLNVPKASARAITLNFITGGLGSAMFSLPWSLAGSSIIPSIVIIAAVLILNAWTIGIIVRAAEKHQVFDLGSVISHLPHGLGPPLQAFTNVFVWISMFLCLVSYIIVIHDAAYEVLRGTWFASRVVLVSFASILVLPLCFFSQRLLEKTSSIAIAINVYLFVLVGAFYAQYSIDETLPDGCCLLGATLRGNFSMMTVMFQAVIIQMCVLPMYAELENRSPEKFDRIVAVGFGVLFFLFCSFSIVAYLLVGPGVSNDVLSDLPRNGWSKLAQVGVTCVVACVYPIMLYPMIAPLQASTMIGPLKRRMIVTGAKVMIVAGGWLTAMFVTSLGFINGINGAMSAAIFVALVPSVVGYAMLDTGSCCKFAYVALLVCGLVVAGMGFKFSDNYVGDLQCIVSV